VESKIGYTLTYDTRTSGINPLGGVLLRFGQDFAGVGGDVSSVNTTALAQIERSVMNEEVNLRATFEGGVLAMLDDENSRVVDRYFGNGQIRGFESNGLGPRDLTAPNQDALGGNYFAAVRLETDFPLGVPNEYGIRGGLFLDAGTVWSLDDTAGNLGPVDDSFRLRSTIGFSLFLNTPLGPLRLNFTEALVKEDYDEEQSFDLTIATTF
jgi:outer membrane protein insertion porin family